MEFWDVYDQNRMHRNRLMLRGETFQPGDCHMVVHICIFNAAGEMLIQQRQPFKEGWPNRWDVTVGGSALAGETSQEAAEREMREELGLQVNLRAVRPNMTVNFDHGFDDFYLLEQNVNLDQLTLQPQEVQAVRWASLPQILELVRSGAFIPYYSGLLQVLFEMRGHYGCQRLQA